jgi:hypothetical protein
MMAVAEVAAVDSPELGVLEVEEATPRKAVLGVLQPAR